MAPSTRLDTIIIIITIEFYLSMHIFVQEKQELRNQTKLYRKDETKQSKSNKQTTRNHLLHMLLLMFYIYMSNEYEQFLNI